MAQLLYATLMPRRSRLTTSAAKASLSNHTLVLRALDEVGGAAVVLDEALRVVAATDGAQRALGERIPAGVSAPKLLCGDATKRPMAEALAEGRAVATSIPRPRPDGGERLVHVRAIPLTEGPNRVGWVLLFDEDVSTPDDADAAIVFHGMITRDRAMKRMFRIIERAARSDVSLLIRGETGAGKELVANAIHALSPRHDGPFRAINCAALPANLLESELFGHVRGAFTGAVRDHPGHFKLANEGTLFLDEVAELPLDLQAKLLRVLETHSVIPLGGRDAVPVNARIVAATHRALRREVDAGRFRADLMYRLRVVPIFLPPLRARKGDIWLLTQRFIEARNRAGGRIIERVASGARTLLERHPFPGNVRELKNFVEYAFVVGEGPVLVEADLPPELLDASGAAEDEGPSLNIPPDLPLNEPPGSSAEAVPMTQETAQLLRVLERAGGSRQRAAQMLGISRVTLWRKMRALGILPQTSGAG